MGFPCIRKSFRELLFFKGTINLHLPRWTDGEASAWSRRVSCPPRGFKCCAMLSGWPEEVYHVNCTRALTRMRLATPAKKISNWDPSGE